MMLQDISPRVLFNQYDTQARAGAGDLVMVLKGRQILGRIADGQLFFPTAGELFGAVGEAAGSEGLTAAGGNADAAVPAALTYLFRIDGERFFLYVPQDYDAFAAGHPAWQYLDLKELRESSRQPRYYVFAAYTAQHLNDWYRDTRFCGRCGKPMTHSLTERAMTCPACRYTAYPRIMPAVIVGVINGDRLLVTRYSRGYNHNALIAGFTEIGETLEETVAREVMEEAGIRVRDIRYYKSQPWGASNDILMGYYCRVDGDPTITMDGNELKSALWLRAEEIELQPDESSLTNEMMRNFKEGLVR